jgi:hypothetical protein
MGAFHHSQLAVELEKVIAQEKTLWGCPGLASEPNQRIEQFVECYGKQQENL